MAIVRTNICHVLADKCDQGDDSTAHRHAANLKEATMKSLVIATILAATAFAASAQPHNGEIYEQLRPSTASSKSRAEVMVEARAAQRSGVIAKGEMWVVEDPQSSTSLSRAQVKQEVLGLRKSGKLPANGEITGG